MVNKTQPPARERRLHQNEHAILIAAATSYGEPLPAIIHLAIETGMRRTEIASMRWEHVNFSNCTLNIPETKTIARRIPLSPAAIEILHKQPRRLDGKVFDIQPHSITQAFNRACKRANIETLRFHDLRHEATSRLFERGWSTMEVAAVTGHKDLKMLLRYTHLRPENLAKKFEVATLDDHPRARERSGTE